MAATGFGLVVVVLVGVVAVAGALPPRAAATVIALGLLVVAAIVDARIGRLPGPLLGAALLPVVAVAASVTTATGSTGPVTGVVAGAALAGLPTLVPHLIDPASMGFGDVKAACVLGAALGLVEPRLALVAVCLAAAAGVLFALMLRRRSIAFGPYLVGAGIGVAVMHAAVAAGVMP